MSPQTTRYKTGDVITVSYYRHEDDKSRGEPRRVICLEDYGDNFLAVPLKSCISHKKFHPNSFIIEKDSEEGKRMNLLNDSLIVPGRASIIPKTQAWITGYCSEELQDRLNELLK